jgi:Heparinase II/III-like protein/Heparinase II/III N-terminus
VSADGTPGAERGSLRWYWNRVRVMGPLEIPYRAAAAVGSLRDQTLDRLGIVAPPPARRRPLPEPWLPCAKQLPQVDAKSYLLEADAFAIGRIAGLDGTVLELGAPADWEVDLRAGGAGVAGTSSEPGAGQGLHDVRLQMELHRHGHLVRLAQAWCLAHDARHVAALLHQLESWLDQCPFPRGVAWASALDAGLRLLNWSIVWQLLRCDRADSIVPEPLRQRWLASIFVHARFVRQNRSRHSSANNHLLGELLGLVVAEATWPVWPELLRWGASARSELLVEALRQTHPDGSGREQASWYQVFVFELLAVFVQVDRSQGRACDERLLRRMAAMAVFIAALRDRGGHISHHGDADHARALCVDPGLRDPYDAMLSLAVAMGLVPDLRALADGPSQIAAWLLPAAEVTEPRPRRSQRRAVRKSLPRAFPQGGYHLLGQHFGMDDEVLMVVDTGALGYLSIAAHGHADALSLRLSVAGQPVLVDRGTYVYNAEPAWRHFFRSTLAHNTVCVDDTDQSSYGGPFMWTRHARTELASFTSTDADGHVEASHDGYRGLASPLVHRRRVEWSGAAQAFTVTDTLLGKGTHDVAVCWHLDPACAVDLTEAGARVSAAGVVVRLRLLEQLPTGSWELHAGDPRGMLGWHSPAFGLRVPAASLVWRGRVQGNGSVRTLIQIEQT